jgi:hypothetical protein
MSTDHGIIEPAEAISARAYQVAGDGVSTDRAVQDLVQMADGDRLALESARNEVADRLHSSVDDWSSTAALTLLNRALAAMPRNDPLDWRVRWGQHFRMP